MQARGEHYHNTAKEEPLRRQNRKRLPVYEIDDGNGKQQREDRPAQAIRRRRFFIYHVDQHVGQTMGGLQ